MVRKILSFIFLASLSSYCYAGAEQVTITTYYPAPYGVYKELRTDQMAVGSTYRNVNPLSDGNLIVSGNVGVGTNSPVPSAIFELSSTNKGFLLPRLTTAQRNNIVNPAFGLMVYNIETNAPEYWNGTQWISNQAFKQKMVSGLVSIPATVEAA